VDVLSGFYCITCENILLTNITDEIFYAGLLCSKYHVRKYPTLKLFRDGRMLKQEYRGERSVSSIVHYIRDQVGNGIKEFVSLNELKNIRVS